MGSVRWIIFDLNGTLVVGEYPSWERVLEDRLGLERKNHSSFEIEDLRRVAKGQLTFKELISKVFSLGDHTEIRDEAYKIYASSVALRDGALEILERLRKRYRLILCSDTTGVAKEVVRRLHLSPYFDFQFFSCDLGHLKSERSFWERCLSSIPPSDPSEFLVVGDRPNTDVYWPRKLGMHTVLIKGEIISPQDWVEKPKGLPEERPEFAVERLSEIQEIIEKYFS